MSNQLSFNPPNVLSNLKTSLNSNKEILSVNIPSYLDLSNLVSNRKKELEKLITTLNIKNQNGNQTKKYTKRAFQLLSKSERRRTMSFNPFRVPKRLRLPIIKDMLENPPRRSKRIRKDRRRAKFISEIYKKRSKKSTWLETHFWHAKRFHMASIWNLRLAIFSNERTSRKIFRKTSRSCTVHDRSYMKVFKLEGNIDSIYHIFEHLGVIRTQLQHEKFINGSFRGTINLFKIKIDNSSEFYDYQKNRKVSNCLFNSPFQLSSNYFQFICPAKFLWSTNTNASTNDNYSGNKNIVKNNYYSVEAIWLWIHPSAYSEIKLTIDNILDLHTEEFKKTINFKEINDLVSFELLGPQSIQIASKCLKIIKSRSSSEILWESIYKNFSNKNHHLIPNQAVLGLEIIIPPIFGPFPPKYTGENIYSSNTKTSGNNSLLKFDTKNHVIWPIWSSKSLIFNEKVREELKTEDFYICCHRSKKRPSFTTLQKKLFDQSSNFFKNSKNLSTKAIPQIKINSSLINDENFGVKVENNNFMDHDTSINSKHSKFTAQPKSVPILIIFKTGGDFNFSQGLEIIFPGGCGASRIWTLINRYGAIPLGIYEYHQILFEAGINDFPFDYPETLSYKKYSYNLSKSLFFNYYRKPASKRVNYSFIGISYPFYSNWNAVLNNFPIINTLRYFYTPYCNSLNEQELFEYLNEILYCIKSPDKKSTSFKLSFEKFKSTLVSIRLDPIFGKIPKTRSHIYRPTNDDLKIILQDLSNYKVLEEKPEKKEIFEPSHKNFRLHKAKSLNTENFFENSKSLKIAAKFALLNIPSDKSNFNNPLLKKEEEVITFSIPYFQCSIDPINISKQLIGFVTTGGYSLLRGSGFGIGCISASQFLEILNEQQDLQSDFKLFPGPLISQIKILVLFRNIEDTKYHPAWMHLLIEHK